MRRIYLPAVIVAIIYFFVTIGFLSWHSWDVTSFAAFGYEQNVSVALGQVYRVDDPTGYDGQMFYTAAHQPFKLDSLVDNPRWRLQRIVYPLTLHVLSGFGNLAILGWVFLVVNFLAIIGSVYLLSKILLRYNLSTYWSLVYGLYPGLLFSYTLNLAEPLAYFFAIMGWYMYTRQRSFLMVTCFTLAALTKEITLLIPLSITLYHFVTNRFLTAKRSVFIHAIPAITFWVWQLLLGYWFGSQQYVAMSGLNLRTPFIAWIERFVVAIVNPHYVSDWFVAVWLVVMLFLVGVSIFTFFQKQSVETTLVLIHGSFMLIYAWPLLYQPREIHRHSVGFLLCLLLAFAITKLRTVRFSLIILTVLGFYFFIDVFIFHYFFF